LLYDLGDRRRYSHFKEEALDRIKWKRLWTCRLTNYWWWWLLISFKSVKIIWKYRPKQGNLVWAGGMDECYCFSEYTAHIKFLEYETYICTHKYSEYLLSEETHNFYSLLLRTPHTYTHIRKRNMFSAKKRDRIS
jgi:hypothetical protein